MGFENVCKSLNAYFSNNKFLAPIQAFALPATFVCGALMIINQFSFISLSWVYSVIEVIFYLSFFMLLGTENFLMIAIALGLKCIEYLLDLIIILIDIHSLSLSCLVYTLTFGFLAYLAYMKSVKGNK